MFKYYEGLQRIQRASLYDFIRKRAILAAEVRAFFTGSASITKQLDGSRVVLPITVKAWHTS